MENYNEFIHLELAGLGNPDGSGLTQRKSGYWLRPRTLLLEGDDLVYSITPDLCFESIPKGLTDEGILEHAKQGLSLPCEPDRNSPGGKLFDEFLGLKEASSGVILHFAKKWGVLELCPHALPTTHTLRHSVSPSPLEKPCLRVSHGPSGDFRESTRHWRWYAVYFRAILNLAAELHIGRVGRDQDWKCILQGSSDLRLKDGPDVVKNQARRLLLVDVLNRWITIAGLQPSLEWIHSRPTLQFATPALFSDT